jgi:hypothetical protein
MIFDAQLPHVPKDLSPFARLVVPAVITLIPAAITAGYKALQDHSRTRRSAELTDRICKLAKDISELPELPTTASEIPVSPRLALIAELNAAVCEITALQSRPAHRIGGVSISVAARLRSALLLYRPKGLLAFTLHVTFYLYSLVMVCFLVSLVTDKTTPLINTKDVSEFVIDVFLLIIVSGIFSIPALVLRNYAARIHRKQTPEPQLVVPAPVSAPMAAPLAGHGD